jgi:hypothetical protein
MLIDNFISFNIIVVPDSQNLLDNLLATKSSRLLSLEEYKATRITIEFFYKPFVLDNDKNWRVFEGDE